MFMPHFAKGTGGSIIKSPLDDDFYKFRMAVFVLTYFPDVHVTFKLIVRTKHLPLALIIREDDLRLELDLARECAFIDEKDPRYISEFEYLARYIPEIVPHRQFFRSFKLPPYILKRVGDTYELSFPGRWAEAKFWEIKALAIINELKSRAIVAHMTKNERTVYYARAKDRIYRDLIEIRDTTQISFLGFGLRRHESFWWESFVTEMAQGVMGERFLGTSTVSIAKRFGMPTSGTMAHELMMVAVALASSESPEAMIHAQYDVLRKWEELFSDGLIFLPDAYGTEQFFRNMPEDFARHVAHTWKGGRWDSGDVIEEGERHVAFFRKHGVDPWKAEKIGVPSDGLDVPLMQKLDRHFIQEKVIRLVCGWGTNFTNQFKGCHPRGGEQAVMWGNPVGLTWNEICGGQSIVIKVDSVNGIPAAKLSNNPNKATGRAQAVERDKKVFGVGVRELQETLV